jgi:hypothetical protein
MRWLVVVLLSSVLASPAWACPILPIVIQDVKGNALASASVTVYLAGTTTLATLYSNATCTVTKANPATTSSNGTITSTYIQDGIYDILYAKTEYASALVEDVMVDDPYTVLTPTYATTVTINRAGAQRHVITVTDTSNFTISAPTGTHATNSPLWITIKNSSGGAVGTITWNAAFKMATFTNAADGFNRSILFLWNGSNWLEQVKTPADVAN